MRMELAPSMLAADFGHLAEQLQAIEVAGADRLHFDVMDGMFVPSISFGMPVMTSIRPYTKLPFDVHLMIEDPDRYLEDFRDAGAYGITVHAEACTHLHRTITRIRELGMHPGVALNPATDPSVLRYVLPELDLVLVMSVNPGFGGQKFIPFSLEKIHTVRAMAEACGCAPDIEVDGGINAQNVQLLMDAGANVFVAGTSVFHGDIAVNVQAFRTAFQIWNDKEK